MRVVLLSCSSSKKNHPCSARDMYDGALFKYSIKYAEKMNADKIFILSAKYGLLDLDEVIDPYDVTLNHMDKSERASWGQNVLVALSKVTDLRNDFFYLFCGAKYREFIQSPLRHCFVPTLGFGIGKQLAFFKNNMDNAEILSSCGELHEICSNGKIFKFPFDKNELPKNGLYVLFENNEAGHGQNRIVRVGTHTGENELRSRIAQHFLTENKNRSIFRKNIGRAFLSAEEDLYLEIWELDNTSSKNKKENASLIDFEYEKKLEEGITEYIRNNFSFVIIEEENKDIRLLLESKIATTISKCTLCAPSKSWLGNSSPKEKIRISGLWQVNELNKSPLKKDDLKRIEDKIVKNST